jgi:protocatechuate 3,4-dioxygenase, alpha subunit
MKTPSQTVGPFFSIGLGRRSEHEVAPGGDVRIEGRVLDGAGEPVPDAMVEIWQADESGEHRSGFGWARCETDDMGRYRFVTVKPGTVDGQAPHITMLVFARGLLKPVLTRLYFPDEVEANAADTVLDSVPAEARPTLVAVQEAEALRFDVRLQGDNQTAFFEL